MSKYFLCMCVEYMWRSQNNLKYHCSTGIVNHFLGDRICCWDPGLNEPKSPRHFLCLRPQFWDHNHMPPCYAFYMDAGDGTWVLTLTHNKWPYRHNCLPSPSNVCLKSLVICKHCWQTTKSSREEFMFNTTLTVMVGGFVGFCCCCCLSSWHRLEFCGERNLRKRLYPIVSRQVCGTFS